MLEKQIAYWTYDAEAGAYYFEIGSRRPPPYREQRQVAAILDIADDGTLAGIELVLGELPPPPPETQAEREERRMVFIIGQQLAGEATEHDIAEYAVLKNRFDRRTKLRGLLKSSA